MFLWNFVCKRYIQFQRLLGEYFAKSKKFLNIARNNNSFWIWTWFQFQDHESDKYWASLQILNYFPCTMKQFFDYEIPWSLIFSIIRTGGIFKRGPDFVEFVIIFVYVLLLLHQIHMITNTPPFHLHMRHKKVFCTALKRYRDYKEWTEYSENRGFDPHPSHFFTPKYTLHRILNKNSLFSIQISLVITACFFLIFLLLT